MLHLIARVVVAAGLAAAAFATVPVSPASAAGCSTDHGVTVVVDFHELGGGVQTACVADGGGDTAAQLFPAAGFPLTYVQRQPGFVCRVSGKPADDPCVSTPPADAYWGLFWSDGKSGSWSYATTGAGGQHVPDGGYAGFSWNGSSTRTAPGFSPAPHPTATPTPTPTHSPTHPGSSAPPSAHPTQAESDSPSATPTRGSESASPSEKPKPGDKKSRTQKPSPSADPTVPTDSPSESPDEDVAPTSAEPADPDGGLPTWVAPVVVVALFGAAAAAAVVRRRRGASGP